LESNTVFVGNKPVMTYVLSVISRVNMGGNEVTLKARGRAITTAVDAAQIAKRRFMNTLQIEDVKIGTEEVETREGGKRSVSSIEIVLKNEGTAPAKSPEAASEAAPASETGTTA
jgi:DNA-binding protein